MPLPKGRGSSVFSSFQSLQVLTCIATKPYLTSNRCLIEVQLSTYLFKTSIPQRFSL